MKAAKKIDAILARRTAAWSGKREQDARPAPGSRNIHKCWPAGRRSRRGR